MQGMVNRLPGLHTNVKPFALLHTLDDQTRQSDWLAFINCKQNMVNVTSPVSDIPEPLALPVSSDVVDIHHLQFILCVCLGVGLVDILHQQLKQETIQITKTTMVLQA